ncbi:MAG: hypothetical protein NVS3B1_06050 [Marmoricola sp.]
MTELAAMARNFSLWLNSTYPPDLDPEAWMRRRVLKVCEEAGEVHEAVGAFWAENPRKPQGPLADVIKELADCAGAALGAIEHLTGHAGRSLDIVTERVREVCQRVGIEVVERSCPHGDVTCPCQDGDPCHYEALPDSPAWTPPSEAVAIKGATMPNTCRAALNIKGEHFPCDISGGHGTHGNTDAQAVWASDAEATEIDEAHPDVHR